MLPGFLDSAYRKYKNGTSIFTKWIFETTQKCGYSTPAKVAQSAPAAKSARLKGEGTSRSEEGGERQELAKRPLQLNYLRMFYVRDFVLYLYGNDALLPSRITHPKIIKKPRLRILGIHTSLARWKKSFLLSNLALHRSSAWLAS